MPLTDDIERDSPQALSCGALTHALADTLERAEFIERAPALQLSWNEARQARDPDLEAYMAARLAHEHPDTIPNISLADAKARHARAYLDYAWRQEHREQGGLRRVVDAWARWQATLEHQIKIEQWHNSGAGKKEQTKKKRANNKRALEYWSTQLAM